MTFVQVAMFCQAVTICLHNPYGSIVPGRGHADEERSPLQRPLLIAVGARAVLQATARMAVLCVPVCVCWLVRVRVCASQLGGTGELQSRGANVRVESLGLSEDGDDSVMPSMQECRL